MQKETLKKRLAIFLEYLGIGQARFAENVGVSKGFANNVGDSIRTENLNKIKATYPELNINWLLTGEGEMLKNEGQNKTIIDNEDDFEKAKLSGLKLLPEVNFEFSAGTMEIFSSSQFIKRYWYLPDCEDCEGVAQVAGTSMLPVYPPGCWVALKRVGFDINHPNQIPFGHVFGIVVEDPMTGGYHGHIKVLRRYRDQEMSKRYWIARSLNVEEYDDFDIELKDVRGLWIVKQHVVSDVML